MEYSLSEFNNKIRDNDSRIDDVNDNVDDALK